MIYFIYHFTVNHNRLTLKMNVDKFGHHVHKKLCLSELVDFTENCLVKSESGEFNLQSSRLSGVKLPVAFDDVVNKEYVDKMIVNYFTKKDITAMMDSIKTDFTNKMFQLEKKFCTVDYVNKLITKQQHVQAASRK